VDSAATVKLITQAVGARGFVLAEASKPWPIRTS